MSDFGCWLCHWTNSYLYDEKKQKYIKTKIYHLEFHYSHDIKVWLWYNMNFFICFRREEKSDQLHELSDLICLNSAYSFILIHTIKVNPSTHQTREAIKMKYMGI